MRRFFGMMPSAEIEIEKQYKDKNGYRITIQSGQHGWTVIYTDSSTEYKDIDCTTDENFKAAYNLATSRLGELTEIQDLRSNSL
jgi:hypothetical protein